MHPGGYDPATRDDYNRPRGMRTKNKQRKENIAIAGFSEKL